MNGSNLEIPAKSVVHHYARWIIALLGFTLLPIWLQSVCLDLSKSTVPYFKATGVSFVFVVPVALGFPFIALLPLDRWMRLVLGVVYIVAMPVIMFLYTAIVVCTRFGDCF